MTESPYEQYWDKYVTALFPKAAQRDDVRWPGDEWGAEKRWAHIFDRLFKRAEVEKWKNAVEIGQGSGKYTKLVLDAAPECRVAAFDVSQEFLDVCGERLSEERDAGRLFLEHLKSERADEMLIALERLGMAGELDGFFSMDALVHVDFQYVMAYLLTAAVALRPGGHLIMTMADCTTDQGFNFLVSRISRFYGHQGRPVGKFEWVSGDIVTSALDRLGFKVIICANPPRGLGRDIQLVARLDDPVPARDLSWALCDEPAQQRQVERRATGDPPVLSWPAADGATEYAIEFSINKFGSTFEPYFGPVRIAANGNREFAIPEKFWSEYQLGRPLHWRAIGECPNRRQVVNRGVLVRVNS